jgi:trigger factor
MKIEKTSENGLQSTYSVIVAHSDLTKEIEKRLSEAAKKVKLPGFRPGKAPVKMIRERYIADTLMKVSDKYIQEAHKKILDDNKITPAKKSEVDVKKFDENEDFHFELNIEAMPSIEIQSFEGFSFEKPKVLVEQVKIDETLEKIRKEVKVFKKADKKAIIAEGDRVIIALNVFENGVLSKEHSDDELEIHARILSPEESAGDYFDRACEEIIGKKAGDTVSFESFYKKYLKKNKPGKDIPVTCDITIQAHSVPTQAELNDEFAKEVRFESLDELKKKIQEDFEKQYDNYGRLYVKRHLLDKLAETYTFDLPESILKREFDAIWQHLQHEIKKDPEAAEGKSEEELKAEYEGIAKRRVRLGLLISEVAKTHKIALSNDDVFHLVMSQAYKHSIPMDDAVKFFKGNPGALEQLTAPALEEKVVDFILEKATLNEKEMSFEAFKEMAKDVVPMFDEEDEESSEEDLASEESSVTEGETQTPNSNKKSKK